jgi:hypothetical protein
MNTSTTDTHSKDNISEIISVKKADTKEEKFPKKYKNDINANSPLESIAVIIFKLSNISLT